MKRIYTYLTTLCIIAMAAMFAACSSDEPSRKKKPNEDVDPGQFTEKRYIKVALGINAMSRAGEDGEYDPGTMEEQRIDKILFVFYNSADRVVGYSNWIPDGDVWNPDKAEDNISAVTNHVIQINVSPGENDIAKVIAFANPTVSINSTDLITPIYDLSDITRVTPFNGQRFTMNNSVYYEGNTPQIAAPITGDIYMQRSDIHEDSPVSVTIYLDRLAAKVTVDLAPDFNAHNLPITISERTVTFTPEKWMLTATNKKTYLIKHLPAHRPSPDYQWALGPYRYKWCESYGYNSSAIYPTFASDLNNPHNEEYILLNYSCYADQIETNNWGKPQYCMENTNIYSTQNAYRTSRTAVLIMGHYTLSGNGVGASGYRAGDDFYYYQGQFYTAGEIKRAMAFGQEVLYNEDGELLSVDALSDKLELIRYVDIYPDTDDDDQFNYYSNRMGLHINSFDYDDVYYRPEGQTSLIPVCELTEMQQQELQRAMELDSGQAEMFAQGHAYFWVDVEHLNQTGANGNIGKWGVVRNHSYKITINGIERLGTGIANIHTPLIPSGDAKRMYVKCDVKVLNWTVVRQGTTIK